MKKHKGFTLIELLVVILIIGILMAIVIPNYIRFQENARRVSVKANMRVIQTALEGWAVAHDGLYPPADDEDIWKAGNVDGIAPYLPGGDPIGEGGSPTAGNFPTNPYTRRRYNEDDDNRDLAVVKTIGKGENAIVRSLDQGCPYAGLDAPNNVRGAIGILFYEGQPGDGATEEYGICGWGRDIGEPMYDPYKDQTSGESGMLYFALYNN
ncbi:MAG: type II secretion system protein [candidate division WOR-3 bacterium]